MSPDIFLLVDYRLKIYVTTIGGKQQLTSTSDPSPKSEQVQAKTPQEAPPQLKTGSHVKVNAKKKKRRIARIAEHWVLFNELEIKLLMIGIKETMTADAKAKGLNIPESYIKQGLHNYIHRKVSPSSDCEASGQEDLFSVVISVILDQFDPFRTVHFALIDEVILTPFIDPNEAVTPEQQATAAEKEK